MFKYFLIIQQKKLFFFKCAEKPTLSDQPTDVTESPSTERSQRRVTCTEKNHSMKRIIRCSTKSSEAVLDGYD